MPMPERGDAPRADRYPGESPAERPMPTALILAGPNGTGKTTFASLFLRDQADQPVFLNADEIARGLDAPTTAARDMAAGRLLLERLDATVVERRSFIVETTLSTRLYVRRVEGWRAARYTVGLVYVRLPSVADSLARVRLRASRGGHDIAREDVLRRFDRSLALLDGAYKPMVDHWLVLDSRAGEYVPADWSGR